MRIIDIEGMVHHRTEKAILFSNDGIRANAVWLPLSMIEVEDTDSIYLVSLPEHLALEKGLI